MRMSLAAVLALVAWMTANAANATPVSFLTGWNQNQLDLIADGTSNTIEFSETTRLTLCFDRVSTPGTITDGASTTVVFGKATGLRIIPTGLLPPTPIGQITDGTSNTIFFPEAGDDFCIRSATVDPQPPGTIVDGTSNTINFGENSAFDICVNNVNIKRGDGTSNTISISTTPGNGECFQNIRVAEPTTVAVPEPASLALLAVALSGPLLVRLRRHKT